MQHATSHSKMGDKVLSGLLLPASASQSQQVKQTFRVDD